MNSYTQFISSGYSQYGKWYGQIRTGFLNKFREHSNPTDQLRFVLDQTLILAEFFWMYGVRAHECMVTYSRDIKEFTDTVVSKNEYQAAMASILKDIKHMQEVWYGAEWIDVDIKSIKMFLYDLSDNKKNDKFPQATTAEMIIPFLMHRNRYDQEGFTEYVGKVCLPIFDRVGLWTSVSSYDIGVGFSKYFENKFTDKRTLDSFRQIQRFSVLTFLAKTTLRYKYFDEVLGLLATLCLHGDVYRVVSANFKLFYATAVILNCVVSSDFLEIVRLNGSFPISYQKDWSPYREQAIGLFALLTLKHFENGLKMSSRELFVRFFSAFVRTKDGKSQDLEKIIELVASNARCEDGVVAAESLNALKRITGFCSMEAIDLISRHTTASTQEPGTDETVEETTEEEPNPEFTSYEDIFPEDADPALEAEAEGGDQSETEEDNAPAEDDEGSGDPSTGDGDEEENTPDNPDEGDADGNASGEEPGGSDPSTTVNTQSTGEPESVEASDDEGIEVRFVPEGSETVESVILREELDQFITEVLVNPPKKLSPQAVSALTSLQQYCIHLLSVETIVGILGKLVALPDKFKTIKNSHGENS